MKTFVIPLVAVISAALGACSTVPERNASLEQARFAVSQAQADPKIVQHAAVDLKRAQDTLRDAELVWRDSPRDTLVGHLSYLAAQQAAIAREMADMQAAELAVQQVSRDRDNLLLQARTREAEQAREQIAASESEAERARREAESAREQARTQEQMAMTSEQRAEHMQQQLQDLQAQETERGLEIVLSGVLFESGQSTLKPGATRRLEQLANVLRENPERIVLVEGFADSVGDESFNEELSEKRAQAVRDTLASLGVDAARIRTQGYGEAFPVASNKTPAGRQQNRRVEIVVSSESADIPRRGFVGRAGGETRGQAGVRGSEREQRMQQEQPLPRSIQEEQQRQRDRLQTGPEQGMQSEPGIWEFFPPQP